MPRPPPPSPSSEYENDYRTLETIGADIVCKESYIGTPVCPLPARHP